MLVVSGFATPTVASDGNGLIEGVGFGGYWSGDGWSEREDWSEWWLLAEEFEEFRGVVGDEWKEDALPEDGYECGKPGSCIDEVFHKPSEESGKN